MQVERVLLETDDKGNLIGVPKLPPNTQLEAIFLMLGKPATSSVRRRPHPAIAGKGQTYGDLIAPIVDEDDWDCLQ